MFNVKEKKVFALLQPLGSTSGYSLTPSLSDSAAGTYDHRFSLERIIRKENPFTTETITEEKETEMVRNVDFIEILGSNDEVVNATQV
ncbi:hypothetical protein HDU92_000703 [Lobulomyces angularis]|nr:hypothetical protein HDU92_000703 [Lobulomyces angularis]